MKTVMGLYVTLDDAHQVVRELINNGIDRHHISLIARNAQGRYSHLPSEGQGQTEGEVTGAAVEGAAVGGAIGGVAGLLLGLGALAIPGLGPVIAAGPLVAGLVGAGIGAASGGLLGALTEAGIPEEEARFYVEGVRRGGVLVAVKVFNDQVDRVVDVMEHHNPVDIEQRAAIWIDGDEEEGVEMPTAELAGDTDFDAFVDVDEEDYRFYETTFRRHFMTNFATENNRYRDYEPAYRYGYDLATDAQNRGREWDEIEAEAQQRWTERNQGAWESFKDAVKCAWLEVNQTRAGEDKEADVAGEPTFASFRRHYEKTYAASGYPYSKYEPAYRYGYYLAADDRYRDRGWNEIEPEVQHYWQDNYQGNWEAFREAVRHGWEEVQQSLGESTAAYGTVPHDWEKGQNAFRTGLEEGEREAESPSHGS